MMKMLVDGGLAWLMLLGGCPVVDDDGDDSADDIDAAGGDDDGDVVDAKTEGGDNYGNYDGEEEEAEDGDAGHSWHSNRHDDESKDDARKKMQMQTMTSNCETVRRTKVMRMSR